MSVLKPGALVQHEDGGTGTIVDGMIGWAVRKHDGSGSFCWSGALEDHGWSLVGSGFAPEGARLAWVTDDIVESVGYMAEQGERMAGIVRDLAGAVWAEGLESAEAEMRRLGAENERLRGVVEALAATEPYHVVDVIGSAYWPNGDSSATATVCCIHCSARNSETDKWKLSAISKAELLLEHTNSCVWSAAVVALEGEAP